MYSFIPKDVVIGQLLTLSPEMVKFQFAGGGGGWWPTFDASPEMLKSQIPIFAGGKGGGGGGWWPTFDAESRNANIKKYPFLQLGGGVSDQLLMLSPNLLKSKKKITRGFAEHFLSFQAKKCLGMNGFGLRVPSCSRIRVYDVYANHKRHSNHKRWNFFRRVEFLSTTCCCPPLIQVQPFACFQVMEFSLLQV